MGFEPRLTIPKTGNKYYIRKVNGGYSNAIEGKCKSTGKPHTNLNVLANCVGYAYGRFHEIIGDTKMSYVSPVNAENFPEYAPKCKQGKTPKLGAIIVWQKGTTLKGNDGAGHVAIVEEIISDTQIKISQSGYNGNTFWTEIATLKNGNWACSWMGSAYKFRCFIYNPAITDDTKPVTKKGSMGIYVKYLQESLNKIGDYKLVADGSFGDLTVAAVKSYQKSVGLTADGSVGDLTWAQIDKSLKALIKPEGVTDLNFYLDGKLVTAWNTVINNQNYIRIVDLEKIGLAKSVKYDTTKKAVIVKTK